MHGRQKQGAETVSRLREWQRGQPAAERLSGHLVRAEGFESIDPSHPLGGPDGLKDLVCTRDNQRWICAAYFPRGQKTFAEICKKFKGDSTGVVRNDADGLVFVTNQELRLGERAQLEATAVDAKIELLHLERIASKLDSPALYGVRLEFLDIEMSKEEQIAFIADRDAMIARFQESVQALVEQLEDPELPEKLSVGKPLSELQKFKSILDSIASFSPYAGGFLGGAAHMDNLRVPLGDLREFASLLNQIAGYSARTDGGGGHIRSLTVPLDKLKEFADILNQIAGHGSSSSSSALIYQGLHSAHVRNLAVPIEELKEYEATLDRILEKKKHLGNEP